MYILQLLELPAFFCLKLFIEYNEESYFYTDVIKAQLAILTASRIIQPSLNIIKVKMAPVKTDLAYWYSSNK